MLPSLPDSRCLCALIAAALLVQGAAAKSVVARHAITIEGIAEVPEEFPVEGLGLEVEVVEYRDGNSPTIHLVPGAAKATDVTVRVPVTCPQARVLYEWWLRIAAAQVAEPHGVDVVGYDFGGMPVAGWYLENAWPVKVTVSPLRAGDPSVPKLAVVLHVADIRRVPTDQTAPWPRILATVLDRAVPGQPRLVMTWASADGASYSVHGWDPATGESPVILGDLVARGATMSATVPVEGPRGFFYVVLTSPPPPPAPPP